MPERLSRLRNTGAVLSLAAILVACGDNGEDKTTRGKTDTNYESAEQTHPTAEELATAQGGTVSQFAHDDNGLIDYARFCRENAGTVERISTVDKDYSVTCQVGDIEYVLGGISDESVLLDLCKQAGGKAVGVAVEIGSDFNVPACHIKTLG